MTYNLQQKECSLVWFAEELEYLLGVLQACLTYGHLQSMHFNEISNDLSSLKQELKALLTKLGVFQASPPWGQLVKPHYNLFFQLHTRLLYKRRHG